MNKLEYKVLLEKRKKEELLLFDLIEKNNDESIYDITEAIDNLKLIAPKRYNYILEKWCSKGILNCGVSIYCGWLEYNREDFLKYLNK